MRIAPWLAGAATVAIVRATVGERSNPVLFTYDVSLDRPGLPSGGLTLLHLSDLHLRRRGAVQDAKLARALRIVAGLHYDLAVITGDLVHDAAGVPAALRFVRQLRAPLGVFACLGNHDYCEGSVWGVVGSAWREDVKRTGRWRAALQVLPRLLAFGRKVLRNERVHMPVAYNDVAALRSALRRCGVQVLVNEAVKVRTNGLELWIAGLDDLAEGTPDVAGALRPIPDQALKVLLAHNPDAWTMPGAEGADLVLAGHTHGGQVRIPVLGAAHTQGTHLSRRSPAGWFRRGQSRMFVNSGLGESVPVRLGVPPQIVLLRLHSNLPAPASDQPAVGQQVFV